MDFETLLEKRDQELAIGGRTFTFEELTGSELRAYLRRVEASLRDARQAVAKMDEASTTDVAEVVLKHEEAFFARLLGVEEEWVRDNVTSADKLRIFATIDKINGLDTQVKNWDRLRAEAGAIKIHGLRSVTFPRPAMDASPGTSGDHTPPDRS